MLGYSFWKRLRKLFFTKLKFKWFHAVDFLIFKCSKFKVLAPMVNYVKHLGTFNSTIGNAHPPKTTDEKQYRVKNITD